ncbi:MAG: PVC-type heme-binding CxxCH protein [Vicinamibacterales bacterium]
MRTIGALLLLAGAVAAAQSQQKPPAGTETRDRYLNPRETDISLGLEVDPRDIPDIPPVEPEHALETFRIKQGFRLELVAHEPLVVDPIQLAFDEDGRLYVVEMRWYQSETRTDLMFDERIGRIRLLEDSNGDGTFEKSTIFADKLRYPSAVFPYNGGVYVGLEPDLLYMKDINGDGVADIRQVVFTGFGNQRDRLDSQMFMNSLTWSLDNRIHGAKGHGGTIVSVAATGEPPLDLRGRDFSFDPRSHRLRAESGGGKQGLSFDDYGRKFVCTQTNAVQMLMYEDRYAGRNPNYSPPPARIDIALDQGETNDRQLVHRISPEDPWRRIRNRWRAEGVFAGPPPQPPAYLIASSGVTLYRGDAFPPDYRHSAFVGVAGNNLVHHRTLTTSGVGLRARRAADETSEEFLASTDLWFRPVAFANGPDGALYVADLYREILDFSDGIPESIKRVKDLNRGNDRGRIYRIVPDRFRRPAPVRLGRLTTAELVATLAHTNAWHRETAARLLYERQDKSAIPALVRLLEESSSAMGRLHALYALEGLDALSESDVLRGLADPEAGVREHAVRLSERFAAHLSEALWRQVRARVDDQDARVRYQTAFTLGELSHPDRNSALAELLKRDVDQSWMHVAVLTSLAEGTGEVFSRLASDATLTASSSGQTFLRDLLRVIGSRNKGRELLAALGFLDSVKDRRLAFAYLSGFADGLQRADVPLALFQSRLQPLIDHALTTVRDPKAVESTRVQAIELLGLTSPTSDLSATLRTLLTTNEARAVQSAALGALNRLDRPDLAGGIIQRWSRFTPLQRRELLPVLLARPERAMALVKAIASGLVLRNELTPTQTAFLMAHRNQEVREAAAPLFSRAAAGDRRAVIERYRPALDLRGSDLRGQSTYKARCAVCHDPGSDGNVVAPSLTTVKSWNREEILTHIVEPNRTVEARYRLYLVELKDGSSLSGIMQNETQISVTLRPPFAQPVVVQRANIVGIKSLEQSMMPEGLEDGLSQQDMADLLQFIVGRQ